VAYIMREGQRIEIETLNAGYHRKRRKSFEFEWVKVPRHWVTGLARTRSSATYRLAFIILIEAFKRKHLGGKIVLSFKVTGIPHTTRMRAALELVELGLIEIRTEARKAAVVSKLRI
jgi:hypothetical protein